MEDVDGTLATAVWVLGAVFGLEVSLPTHGSPSPALAVSPSPALAVSPSPALAVSRPPAAAPGRT
jgi:hypothetical protein